MKRDGAGLLRAATEVNLWQCSTRYLRSSWDVLSVFNFSVHVHFFWSSPEGCFFVVRKRISATEAIEHPFLELAHHRGLGNRIALDRHRAYMFRRKWEVCQWCIGCSFYTANNTVLRPLYSLTCVKNWRICRQIKCPK